MSGNGFQQREQTDKGALNRAAENEKNQGNNTRNHENQRIKGAD